MANLILSDMWDKDNEDAKDIHGISSIIFGDKFDLIYNKYVYGAPDPNKPEIRRLYTDSGEEFLDEDIKYMAPMIKVQGNKVVGYLMGDKVTEKELRKRTIKQTDDEIDMSSLDSMVSGILDKPKVHVFTPEGKIVEATVSRINKDSRSSVIIEYQGNKFFTVMQSKTIINHLECTVWSD